MSYKTPSIGNRLGISMGWTTDLYPSLHTYAADIQNSVRLYFFIKEYFNKKSIMLIHYKYVLKKNAQTLYLAIYKYQRRFNINTRKKSNLRRKRRQVYKIQSSAVGNRKKTRKRFLFKLRSYYRKLKTQFGWRTINRYEKYSKRRKKGGTTPTRSIETIIKARQRWPRRRRRLKVKGWTFSYKDHVQLSVLKPVKLTKRVYKILKSIKANRKSMRKNGKKNIKKRKKNITRRKRYFVLYHRIKIKARKKRLFLRKKYGRTKMIQLTKAKPWYRRKMHVLRLRLRRGRNYMKYCRGNVGVNLMKSYLRAARCYFFSRYKRKKRRHLFFRRWLIKKPVRIYSSDFYNNYISLLALRFKLRLFLRMRQFNLSNINITEPIKIANKRSIKLFSQSEWYIRLRKYLFFSNTIRLFHLLEKYPNPAIIADHFAKELLNVRKKHWNLIRTFSTILKYWRFHDGALLNKKELERHKGRNHQTKKILRWMPRYKLYSGHDTKKTIRGIKISVKGKINATNRTRVKIIQEGIIPIQSFNKNVAYAMAHARVKTGAFGIKVWIYT